MNESTNAKQLSAIDAEIENINSTLGRIEKSVAYALEVFRRFDRPANALNPDDFFRNHPVCESNEVCDPNGVAKAPIEPYIKSGHVLRLNELAAYANQINTQIDDLTHYHMFPTVNFFERNI